MQLQRRTLYQTLQRFYASKENLQQLSEVLGRNPPVSLRTIDWLVTNYSKADNCYVDGCLIPTNIHIAYKAAQSSVKKKLMDPFCRRERITFTNVDGDPFVTTLGQLNFFRWAIKTGVLNYAIQNASAIEKHMLEATAKTALQEESGKQPGKKRYKRKELSKSANRSCSRSQIRTVIKV